MKFPKVRALHKRFAIAFVVCLCCLLCVNWGGAKSQIKRSNPCEEASAHPPSDDFELVPQQFSPRSPQQDVNNFLLNPQWGWQVRNPIVQGANPKRENFPNSIDPKRCANACFRDCTGEKQRTVLDLPEGCFMCNLAQRRKNRVLGHVNWFTATYTGSICFHNCSYPDMDYTFSLVPKGWAGLTRWNAPSRPDAGNDQIPKVFHVEFDSRETVNRFKSPIWSDFGAKASPCTAKDVGIPGKNSCKPEEAKKMIEHKRAVVIGLFGLDSEHNIYSELHPVYAMAVEMNADPKDNTWIIFARNTGNEGACSISDHPLECPPGGGKIVTKLMLLIPPPEGVVGVPEVLRTAKTQFYSNTSACPEMSYFVNPDQNYTEDNQGVLLTFNLDTCAEQDCIPLVEGELHLKWNDVRTTSAPSVASRTGGAHEDACILTESLMENESDSFDKPTSAQAARLLALLAQERNEFAAQMIKCPFEGEVVISRGQPAASVCAQAAAPLLATAPLEGAARPTDRVARIREKIEKILKSKSK